MSNWTDATTLVHGCAYCAEIGLPTLPDGLTPRCDCPVRSEDSPQRQACEREATGVLIWGVHPRRDARGACREPLSGAVRVWFLPTMGPKLIGINLKEEGARQQAEIAGSAELGLGVMSAARHFDIRAYRVTHPDLVDRTVAELETLPQDTRVFIVRIRHGGEIVEPIPSSVVRRDDVIAVAARQEVHVERGVKIGPEVDDKALLDIPVESLDAV